MIRYLANYSPFWRDILPLSSLNDIIAPLSRHIGGINDSIASVSGTIGKADIMDNKGMERLSKLQLKKKQFRMSLDKNLDIMSK
jgi:hypothetical protein